MSMLESPSAQLIAEADRTYIENARALNRREHAGKIDYKQRASIHDWQLRAALRRMAKRVGGK